MSLTSILLKGKKNIMPCDIVHIVAFKLCDNKQTVYSKKPVLYNGNL